jgi:hypothetical protein
MVRHTGPLPLTLGANARRNPQLIVAKQSLAAAEKALEEVKAIIEGSKRADGKLPAATIKKVEKFLLGAV